MRLTPEDRRRYARHLALAEIGEEVQALFLATRVAFEAGGDAGAREVTAAYLARSGVAIEPAATAVAENGRVLAVEVPSEAAIEALAGDALLTEAARSLAGAFTAVEALKRIREPHRSGVDAPLAPLDLPCLGPDVTSGRP